MTTPLSRRSVFLGVGSLLFAAAAGPASSATAETKPAAEAKSNWQLFQEASQITGVYTADAGTYVLIKPKQGRDYHENWTFFRQWRHIGEDTKDLHVFAENNSDNEAALFFIPKGERKLYAQNIVGYLATSVIDIDIDPNFVPEVFKDDAEAAKYYKQRDVLSILTKRDVFKDYQDGTNEAYGGDLTESDYTFAIADKDAILSSPEGDNIRFVRDEAAETNLKKQLAKGQLQLGAVVPENMATLEAAYIEAGTTYITTKLASNGQLSLHIINPDNKQTAQYDLTPASPARKAVSAGGFNNFYKLPDGQTFTIYNPPPKYVNAESKQVLGEASLKPVSGGKSEKISMRELGRDELAYQDIAKVRLLRGPMMLQLVLPKATYGYLDYSAIVDIPSACPPRANRPLTTTSHIGFEIANRNNGG